MTSIKHVPKSGITK